MVQCHMCQAWVHPECVGEDDKDIIGIWSCTSCRMLPTLVERLLEKTSMPRLNKSHKVFDVNEELPDQYVISVCTTFKALESVKANKATGPDNIPAWVLRNYANVLAPPLTAIFNNSLRNSLWNGKWPM